MRRALQWCVLGTTGLAAMGFLAASLATAEPRAQSEPSAAPGSGPHAPFGGGRGGAPTSLPRSALPTAGQHPSHVHTAGNAGIVVAWPYWGIPYLWTGAYTPAFMPYYPTPQLPWGTTGGAAPVAVQSPAPTDPQNPGAAPAVKGKPRPSNVEAKARAGKFIGYGDVNFGKQKYLPAVERYKTAAQIAPDMADIYFREGYALVALANYEEAIKAFRRGLGIRPEWHDSAFRLDQLYGDDRLAKTAHLENLAKAVEANPLDANLLVVLGIQLFFDGQRNRAEVFFARAAQLGANEDRLLDDFVPKPAPAGAQQEPKGGKLVF